MVNHGPSRACKTCKLRRKKCDEARPSCQRCVTAARTCFGYQDDVDIHFRRYRGCTNTRSSCQTFSNSYDKSSQSLPWAFENLPESTIDVQIEDCALTTFFNDYCLTPEHRLLSHGYLDGLESLLADAGPSSNLAQASKIVALASIGTKMGRSTLVHKARTMYSGMLHSLQVMISNGAMTSTAELLMTAVLLGLYEIITATEAHPPNHGSHSCGIHAILSTTNSPLDLLGWANRLERSSPRLNERSLKTGDILCAPTKNESFRSLDALLVKSWPLLQTTETLLSSSSTLVEDIHQVLKEAISLDREFSHWPVSQPEEWRPRAISFVNRKQSKFTQGLSWLPERIDTYLDLYVAAVWNTYRKIRLMILNVIVRCSKRLEKKNTRHDERIEAEGLVNDMAASIPFHLFQNLTKVIEQAENGLDVAIIPGKSVGGLLLMHPLFITSNLPVVLPHLQVHMRENLAWIGTHMGIGQAKMLSNTSATFPNESVANGYVLIWAGMFFTRLENR